MSYDLITIGGGLAGAALAQAMAKRGKHVLVLERETIFRDRVRGEQMHPWGVAETRALGLDRLLMDCGHEVRWWRSGFVESGGTERDLLATTPHQAGSLNIYHPEMQQAVLSAAEQAGAEIRRGWTVLGVTPGRPATVSARSADHEEVLTAQLVVGADGRASRVRAWGGFTTTRDPERLVITGVMYTGLHLPEDGVQIVRDSLLGQMVLIAPLGRQRFRIYLIQRAEDMHGRLSGAQHLPDFQAACVATGLPEVCFNGAKAAGPLAAFDGADTFVDHPYRNGVVLVGDAAAACNPSFGCGLSLTLRDVRVLRDHLTATEDVDAAGHAYATEHDRYYRALRATEDLLTDLIYTSGPEAEARRERAFARMAQHPEAAAGVDIVGLGPDAPPAAEARWRLFAEDISGEHR